MTQLINASETIVSNKRRVNVVLAAHGDVTSTENFIDMGGHRLRSFALDSNYRTLPVYIDGSPTVYDGNSALIDGKVVDISKSGTKGAYCLLANNTSRDIIPVRNIKIDNVYLPINQYGDVILTYPVIPSPFEIVDEDVVMWMSRPMRLIRVALMEWMVVVAL